MNNFARALRLALRHRLTVFASIACSLIIALIWAGNITAVLPVVDAVMHDKSIPEWIDDKAATSELFLADLDEQHPFETQEGQVFGTPVYMAPEQARGLVNEITPLVDVYSAGAVLYEILSGRPPYAGLSSDQVLERLRAGRVPPMEARALPIPAPLRSVVRRAMAPNPLDRYQTAHNLAVDLQRWMDGTTVAAHQETWFERLGRIGSRYGAAIAIIVFYLVARVIILMTTGG